MTDFTSPIFIQTAIDKGMSLDEYISRAKQKDPAISTGKIAQTYNTLIKNKRDQETPAVVKNVGTAIAGGTVGVGSFIGGIGQAGQRVLDKVTTPLQRLFGVSKEEQEANQAKQERFNEYVPQKVEETLQRDFNVDTESSLYKNSKAAGKFGAALASSFVMPGMGASTAGMGVGRALATNLLKGAATTTLQSGATGKLSAKDYLIGAGLDSAFSFAGSGFQALKNSEYIKKTTPKLYNLFFEQGDLAKAIEQGQDPRKTLLERGYKGKVDTIKSQVKTDLPKVAKEIDAITDTLDDVAKTNPAARIKRVDLDNYIVKTKQDLVNANGSKKALEEIDNLHTQFLGKVSNVEPRLQKLSSLAETAKDRPTFIKEARKQFPDLDMKGVKVSDKQLGEVFDNVNLGTKKTSFLPGEIRKYKREIDSKIKSLKGSKGFLAAEPEVQNAVATLRDFRDGLNQFYNQGAKAVSDKMAKRVAEVNKTYSLLRRAKDMLEKKSAKISAKGLFQNPIIMRTGTGGVAGGLVGSQVGGASGAAKGALIGIGLTQGLSSPLLQSYAAQGIRRLTQNQIPRSIATLGRAGQFGTRYLARNLTTEE